MLVSFQINRGTDGVLKPGICTRFPFGLSSAVSESIEAIALPDMSLILPNDESQVITDAVLSGKAFITVLFDITVNTIVHIKYIGLKPGYRNRARSITFSGNYNHSILAPYMIPAGCDGSVKLSPKAAYIIDRLGGYCEPGLIIGSAEWKADPNLQKIAADLIGVALTVGRYFPSISDPLNTILLHEIFSQDPTIFRKLDINQEEFRAAALRGEFWVLQTILSSIFDTAIERAYGSSCPSSRIKHVISFSRQYKFIYLEMLCVMLQAQQLRPTHLDRNNQRRLRQLPQTMGAVKSFGKDERQQRLDWDSNLVRRDKRVADADINIRDLTTRLEKARTSAQSADAELNALLPPALPYSQPALDQMEAQVNTGAARLAAAEQATAAAKRYSHENKRTMERGRGQAAEKAAVMAEGFRRGELESARKALHDAVQANRLAEDRYHYTQIRPLEERINAPLRIVEELKKAQADVRAQIEERDEFLRTHPQPPSQYRLSPWEKVFITTNSVVSTGLVFDGSIKIVFGISPIIKASNALGVALMPTLYLFNLGSNSVLLLSRNPAINTQPVLENLYRNSAQLTLSMVPGAIDRYMPSAYMLSNFTVGVSNAVGTYLLFSLLISREAAFGFSVITSAYVEYVRSFINPIADFQNYLSHKIASFFICISATIFAYRKLSSDHRYDSIDRFSKSNIALSFGNTATEIVQAAARHVFSISSTRSEGIKTDINNYKGGIYAPEDAHVSSQVIGDADYNPSDLG